jgi:hypothetical protein
MRASLCRLNVNNPNNTVLFCPICEAEALRRL